MMENQRFSRKSRERMKIYLPSITVTLLGFLIAYQFVKPAPLRPSRSPLETRKVPIMPLGRDTARFLRNTGSP